jgi:hypothetical protein
LSGIAGLTLQNEDSGRQVQEEEEEVVVHSDQLQMLMMIAEKFSISAGSCRIHHCRSTDALSVRNSAIIA